MDSSDSATAAPKKTSPQFSGAPGLGAEEDRSGGPVGEVQAQAVLRLLVLLQVHADAQEVGGASRLAALAADAVLDAGRGGDLLRGVDGRRHHLEHVGGAGTHAERAADASV